MDDATPAFGSGRGPRAGGVSRLTSADARQALSQLQSSPLLAEGKACLIGLDAVRQGMGARWPARREMVYQHLERTLQRQVGAHGFFLRISDADYFVAQPSVSRLAGQAFCLNCLREVLHYFLGEALVSHIVVHEVTEIRDGEVNARKLDVAAVEAAEINERARGAVAVGPKAMSQDRWTPFTAGDGRRLRASCHLEPVLQLKTFGRIGLRMVRRVLQLPGDTPLTPAEVRQLTRADMEKIDFATLSRGLNRLQEDPDSAQQPSLILPVSYVTLASHRGRPLLAQFFRAAQSSVKQGLICEVCDIEGVPPGALLTAVSLIRSYCLFVVGRLSETPTAPLMGLKDVGLQGVSIERPASLATEGEFAAFARDVLTFAKPATKTVMFFGLATPREAAVAGLLGATHGSLASPESKVHYVDAESAA